MANVLYISYDGMTDPLGQSQVIPYLKQLSKHHKITILSCEKTKNFSENSDLIKSLLNEANISWVPITYTSTPPVLSTLYDLFNLKRKATEVISKNQIQILHCRSYIAALVGLYLKQKFGVKFIFDMRGFWADERIDGGIWNLKNPLFKVIYSFFKKKEKTFLQQADYTVSLTENAACVLKEKFNKYISPIQVIPCCADLNHFSPSTINSTLIENIKRTYKIIDQDFVLSYVGSIGTWYMLPEMMQFFKELLIKRPESKFLFITHENQEVILAEAQKNGISEEKIIVIKGSRENMPSLISLSNISIFFIKPSYSKKASSPTKMAEILGMGIPLITNAGVGDVDKIVTASNCGMVVHDFSSDAYRKAINKIDDILKIHKHHFSDVAKQYFSLEAGVEKYNDIYSTLTHDDKAHS